MVGAPSASACRYAAEIGCLIDERVEQVTAAARAQIAAQLRAAADAIVRSRGENNDSLAEEICSSCAKSHDAPATCDDPRTIATVAYRHLADKVETGQISDSDGLSPRLQDEQNDRLGALPRLRPADTTAQVPDPPAWFEGEERAALERARQDGGLRAWLAQVLAGGEMPSAVTCVSGRAYELADQVACALEHAFGR